MERDEIIRMAREAGFRSGHITLHSCEPLPFVAPVSATDCLVELQRFAALVEASATEKANERANASWASMCEKMVAAKREACAVAAWSAGMQSHDLNRGMPCDAREVGALAARVIRAQGDS